MTSVVQPTYCAHSGQETRGDVLALSHPAPLQRFVAVCVGATRNSDVETKRRRGHRHHREESA
jgi:hypothetical protein